MNTPKIEFYYNKALIAHRYGFNIEHIVDSIQLLKNKLQTMLQQQAAQPTIVLVNVPNTVSTTAPSTISNLTNVAMIPQTTLQPHTNTLMAPIDTSILTKQIEQKQNELSHIKEQIKQFETSDQKCTTNNATNDVDINNKTELMDDLSKIYILQQLKQIKEANE
jgi:hypothetical protein